MEELEFNFGTPELFIKVKMQKIYNFPSIYEGRLEQVLWLSKKNNLNEADTMPTWYHFQQSKHLPNGSMDLDNSHVSITEMTVHAGPDEPIAVATKLGWVAYGSAPSVSASVQCLLVRKSPTPKQLHQLGKPESDNPK
ncbi:unnamed protein product [Ceratitis capitata]|uniref:(Mediterranean fruit fly) hypothetical protein n=1 Tax=Ceratitis capitata TaxID=7213 RepID=A0A811UU45_CERCA|nr:unnamed protein product [Ceratitis capitata]